MSNANRLLFSSLLLISLSSIASDDLHSRLIIEATPVSQGTVMDEGVPKYEKKFNLTVYKKIKQPIELSGFYGCYRAFDEKGNEFDERTVQADLINTLRVGSKEGIVSFVSKDASVYNAKFVKWSTNCPNLNRLDKNYRSR